MDDITDEDMLAVLGQYDRPNPPPTAASAPQSSLAPTATGPHTSFAPVSSSNSTVAAQSNPSNVRVAPPTSFNAAFGSFTTSSMYTSIANMPSPPPRPAPTGQTVSVTNQNQQHRPTNNQQATALAVAQKPKLSSAHSILVSPRQKGNPLLSHISNVAYEFGEKSMLPDYEMSDTTCALYLSLKYHMLHGNYLQSRLHAIKGQYTTRIILVHVDVEDSEKPMLDITKQSFAFGWTIVSCWSPEEMARYLETFKLYEKKTSDSIQERIDDANHKSKILEALTMVRSINKTDVGNLMNNFGSFAAIAKANKEDLVNCPGMGEKKVHRLFHVLNQPFVTSQATRRLDDTAAAMTPAQLNALHAANVAKAHAALQAQATQKKGAIQYVDMMPFIQSTTTTPATAATASTMADSVAPASASVAAQSAVSSASSAASASSSTSSTVSHASIPDAPRPAHSAGEQPAYDPMDFVS